jgi:hypothetical protein
VSFLSQEARKSGKREQYEFITVNHPRVMFWDVLYWLQNRPQRRLHCRPQGSSQALRDCREGASMKHAEILQTATDLYQDRGLSYGHPTDNMARAARLISAYLEMPITDYQVAVVLSLVKIARSIEDAQKIDTWIDGASYLAIAGQLATEENELYV